MTQLFVARDMETGLIMADRVSVAERPMERAIGLLGRSHLEVGEALWIRPCIGVHTWFMRFSIDVIAMDASGVIVDAASILKPWRMRLPRWSTHSVLELPAGTLLNAQAKVGHRVQMVGWNPAVAPSPSYLNTVQKSA